MGNHVEISVGWDANLDGPLAAFMERIGTEVETDAKAGCPVLTGHLRESISHEVVGATVRVGSNVNYAGYVEEGTRHMHPQPYLRPALYRVRTQ